MLQDNRDQGPDPLHAALLAVDHQRRWVASVFDALGFGPQGAPYELLETGSPALLRRYPATSSDGPVVLLVPAPIKTPDIWDLAPGASVVQRYLESGFRVYMVDWPNAAANGPLGLTDYADHMLQACADAACRDSGAERLLLCGHSLGGTLAALFAAGHPERTSGLITLGAPLHFGPETGAIARAVASVPEDRQGNTTGSVIPGSMLNLISATASPETFVHERARDWFTSLGHPTRLRSHLLVERWTLGETSMPGQLFTDLVTILYRHDGFMRGEVTIGGHAVAPGNIRAPVACVLNRQCEIASPASVLPALEALGTEDRTVFWYEDEPGVSLQHVGMMVGATAHRTLWPELLAWVQARR